MILIPPATILMILDLPVQKNEFLETLKPLYNCLENPASLQDFLIYACLFFTLLRLNNKFRMFLPVKNTPT